MPPKISTSSTLTERDMQYLVGAVKCAKTPLEVNYQQFAEMFELKDAKSGKGTWHALKKKLEAASASEEGKGLGRSPRKRKAEDGGEEGEGDQVEESPKKKGKKGKKDVAAAKVEEVDGE